MNSLETGAWSTEFESSMFLNLDGDLSNLKKKKYIRGSYFKKDLFAYGFNLGLYLCLTMFGLAE